MATLTSLHSSTKSSSKLTRNSKFFKTVIKAIQDKKAEEIVSLDLRKIPEAVADFFIICEASSNTQVRAISDFIEEQIFLHCNEKPYRHEGKQQSHWVLIDYINIVIHVMQPDARKFYKLEEMWSDAILSEHNL